MASDISDIDRELMSMGYSIANEYQIFLEDTFKIREIVLTKLEKNYTDKELKELDNLLYSSYALSQGLRYKEMIYNIGKELLELINNIIDDYTCWPLYINSNNDRFLKIFVKWVEKVQEMRKV